MVKTSCISPTTTTQSNNSPSEKELFIEARKRGVYRVSQRESLTSIAKQFKVDNYKTLMKLIGRKDNKTSLSYGEELKGFKTIKCKPGQGLSSLASTADMKLDDFCALNKIDKNYTPQPNELFFIAFNKNDIKAVEGNNTPSKPINTTPSKIHHHQLIGQKDNIKLKKMIL